jgi:hypothetical protein
MITDTPTPEVPRLGWGPKVALAVVAVVAALAVAITYMGLDVDGGATGNESSAGAVNQPSVASLASEVQEALRFRHGPFDESVAQTPAARLASDAYAALRFRHGPFDDTVGQSPAASSTDDAYEALRFRHE